MSHKNKSSEMDDRKLTYEQISMLKNHIDKHLITLSKKIDLYIEIEDVMGSQAESFSSNMLNPVGTQELIQLEYMTHIYRTNENARFHRIREIDNYACIVATNLSLLIDDCIREYNISLKRWIVEKIRRLSELKDEASNYKYTGFYFPIATSILSPYIFKTQVSLPLGLFASVRNAIRKLIN